MTFEDGYCESGQLFAAKVILPRGGEALRQRHEREVVAFGRWETIGAHQFSKTIEGRVFGLEFSEPNPDGSYTLRFSASVPLNERCSRDAR